MQDKYESLMLKNQLCFPVYLCAKEIVRKYMPILKKLDLTYTQYIVMMCFWEKGHIIEKELGKILLLDPSTLTPLLVKLERKGYIQKTKSELDGRSLDIAITEKGLRLREKALAIPTKMGQCLGLSEKEEKTFYQLLYKVLINIERNEIE